MPKDSETFFDEPEQTEEVSGSVEGEVEQPIGGEETPEKEKGETEQSFIAGTTFKTQEEMAKAYKELQASFTRTSQEFKEAKDLLKQMVPLLTKAENKELNKEIKEDPDAFMKAFVSDPKGTLNSLISEAQKAAIEPLQSELRTTTSNLELQSFLTKHPELNEDDWEPFLKITNKYPEVGSRRDRLEVWLKLLKIDNPDIGERTTQRKEQLEKGALDAKKAAGLGSRKSSTPKQEEGDEFDQVLKLYTDRRAKF